MYKTYNRILITIHQKFKIIIIHKTINNNKFHKIISKIINQQKDIQIIKVFKSILLKLLHLKKTRTINKMINSKNLEKISYNYQIESTIIMISKDS